MKKDIEKLEKQLAGLNTSLAEAKGRFKLLNEQITKGEAKLLDFDHKKEVYKKSVELLALVDQNTKEATKKGFEKIVDYALQYILGNNEYKLDIKFGRRGNLQEVDFNLLTPNCQEAHTPGGGVTDILGLSLRIALLELAKIPGFICFDESFKHLSADYLVMAEKFLRAISEKIHRQIIMVSHRPEFLNSDNNLIEIKGE